jgi:ribonucleoside-diphosphate reductase alpha chain
MDETQISHISVPVCDSLESLIIPFESVLKRNRETKAFDVKRIVTAISAALTETGEAETAHACIVAQAVIGQLVLESEELGGTEYLPTVEHIQDLVEIALMELGFPLTAKAYILYRAKRAEERAEAAEEVLEKVESKEISVTLRDGSSAQFDPGLIRTYIEKNARGFSEIDVEYLMTQLKHNLYEGISVADINQALVLVAKSTLERDPQYGKLASRILINEMNQEVVGDNEFAEGFAEKNKSAFIKNITEGVEKKRYDERMDKVFDLQKLADVLDTSRDLEFEYRGIQVLWDRYCVRDLDQKLLETPQFFWMRIAMGTALLSENPTDSAIHFYNIVSNMLYVPSSPTLIHAGQPVAQLSSCYLNTVEDDLNHIFKVYGDNAQLSKWSGGIGTDWTNIRATNAMIKPINQVSQGVIPFIKIADSTTASINRSGKRRSAAAVYLEVWHLDYEFFLDLRKNTGDDRRRTHDLNTVSWIPDLFMKRVESKGDWTLFSPEEVPELHHIYGKAFEEKYREYEARAARGEMKLHKTIPANDLYRRMLTSLFETGHPWMTFKDPCNVRSPQDHVGVVHNSNLCTEITLNTSATETAVCNLGSISLQRHLNSNATDFDWDKLQETIHNALPMIDSVIDLNYYPTVEAKTSNLKHRPVGLGFMGFQDALFKMKIGFGTDQAVALSDKLMEFFAYHAISASSRLAEKYGAYESYKGSKWDRGLLPQDTVKLLEDERGESTNTPTSSWMDWTPVRDSIRKHGMRNSNVMAIAPTATIGNISNSLPSFEPIYKNLYVKSNFSGDFTIVNEYLVRDLKVLNLWNADILNKIKYYEGSIQQIMEIPAGLRELYREVFEIDTIWTLRHAQVRGRWIDQSQSLNIFCKSVSGKILSETYMNAWKMGIKTTYYLRSLAATSIEKSTIDINKKFDGLADGAAPASPQTPPSATSVSSKNIVQVFEGQICESCQ